MPAHALLTVTYPSCRNFFGDENPKTPFRSRLRPSDRPPKPHSRQEFTHDIARAHSPNTFRSHTTFVMSRKRPPEQSLDDILVGVDLEADDDDSARDSAVGRFSDGDSVFSTNTIGEQHHRGKRDRLRFLARRTVSGRLSLRCFKAVVWRSASRVNPVELAGCFPAGHMTVLWLAAPRRSLPSARPKVLPAKAGALRRVARGFSPGDLHRFD